MSDAKTEKIEQLPIDDVVADPQVRKSFSNESLAELAVSIKEVGILQPILVRPVDGRYVIVSGERRWRAAKLAGLATVPARVLNGSLSDTEVLQRQLIENIQRENLRPLEKSEEIDRLIRKLACTAKVAAATLGMSVASVSRSLSLLKLPNEIREQVANGALPASVAYEIAQIGDPAEQLEMARQAAKGKLSRDSLSGRRKARERNGDSSSNAGVRRATAILSGGRLVSVAAEKLNLEGFIAALEELLGKARKVRSTGVELPTFLRMLRDTTVEKAN